MALETVMSKTTGTPKPAITLTAEDHEKLSRLVDAAETTMPEIADELGTEIDRAKVLPRGRAATDTVSMGAEVVYRDDLTGEVRTVTLVYPHEADIDLGRASVLTPIGTALIGLPVGKSIGWTTRQGANKKLTVLEVRQPDPSASAA